MRRASAAEHCGKQLCAAGDSCARAGVRRKLAGVLALALALACCCGSRLGGIVAVSGDEEQDRHREHIEAALARIAAQSTQQSRAPWQRQAASTICSLQCVGCCASLASLRREVYCQPGMQRLGAHARKALFLSMKRQNRTSSSSCATSTGKWRQDQARSISARWRPAQTHASCYTKVVFKKVISAANPGTERHKLVANARMPPHPWRFVPGLQYAFNCEPPRSQLARNQMFVKCVGERQHHPWSQRDEAMA